jgi:hypothetical protein
MSARRAHLPPPDIAGGGIRIREAAAGGTAPARRPMPGVRANESHTMVPASRGRRSSPGLAGGVDAPEEIPLAAPLVVVLVVVLVVLIGGGVTRAGCSAATAVTPTSSSPLRVIVVIIIDDGDGPRRRPLPPTPPALSPPPAVRLSPGGIVAVPAILRRHPAALAVISTAPLAVFAVVAVVAVDGGGVGGHWFVRIRREGHHAVDDVVVVIVEGGEGRALEVLVAPAAATAAQSERHFGVSNFQPRSLC